MKKNDAIIPLVKPSLDKTYLVQNDLFKFLPNNAINP